MIFSPRLMTSSLPALLVAVLIATSASAITTSNGQTWTPEPDAWLRGNTADASYFGWDVLETAGRPFHGMLRVLDDSTPDLGVGTTATGTRIHQGTNGIANPAPTANGHLSGTTNYYSFNDFSNDTIVGTAPASGSGGHTTVVLQLIENLGGNGLADLAISIDTSVDSWTLDKHLHNLAGNGSGLHWLEWSAPGNDLTFEINMTSTGQHRAIDAFQIDTYWTDGTAPVLNSRQAVPEPASALLAVAGLLAGFTTIRCRNG